MHNLLRGAEYLKNISGLLLILGVVVSINASDCEEWIAGAKSYSVGETVTLDGQGYVCANSAGAWENPSQPDSWFWDSTDVCDEPLNNAPTGINLDNTSIDEGLTIGAVIGNLSAIDPDSLDSHNFSLVTDSSYPDNRSFYINGNILYSNETFDYYNKNIYTIMIRVTDSGGGRLTFDKEFNIAISQVTNLLDWPYSDKIFFNTTASGALLTDSLFEFPVLITLDNSNFDFTQSTDNGADIRFSDYSGNLLSYEIEEWDSVNSNATVWVKAPVINPNSSSDYINIHWGNLNVNSGENAEAIFNSKYNAVWHLSDIFEDTTIANYYNDATGNSNGLDLVSSSDKSGTVALGQSLNGSNDYILVDSFSNDSLKELEITLWVKANSNSSGTFVSKQTQDNTSGFSFGINDSGKLIFTINNGSEEELISDSIMSLTDWIHVTAIYAGNKMRILVNGNEIAVRDSVFGKILNNSNRLEIGRNNADSVDYFSGSIDEVRITELFTGDNWIKLSYLNQKADQKFITVGEDTATVKKPTNLNVVNNNNIVTLTWIDQSDNEIGFEIYRGTNTSDLDTIAIIGSNETLFIDTLSACETSYLYAINAFTAQHSSGLVPAGNNTNTIPCKPDSIRVTGTNESEISLEWVGSATNYELEVLDSLSVWVFVTSGSAISFTHQGLLCNTEYQYRVRATNEAGGSEWSDVVIAKTGFCSIEAPTDLVGENFEYNKVSLIWSDNSDIEDGYRVYRKTSTDTSFLVIAELASDIKTYVDETVECDSSYTYYIQAFDSYTVSGASNNITIDIQPCWITKNTSEMLTITGVYLDSLNNTFTGNKTVNVKLYSNMGISTSTVYEETFLDNEFRNGYFQLPLGLNGDVQTVVVEHETLYYDIFVDGQSIYSGNMRPLTASPYAIKSNYNLHGQGSPIGVIDAPVGASYVDTQNRNLYMKSGLSNSDWIKVAN